MPIAKVQMPDGRIARFQVPEGTAPEQVMEFVQAQNIGQAKPEPQTLKGDLGHQAAAGLISFGQGGMPIFDELGAAGGAALEKIGLGPGGNLGYDKRLENIRAVEGSFNQQHPYIDPALRVAGAIAATAPLGGAMAARPVLAPSAYGALQGFTGAEGGAGNRAFSGAAGAALGAAGGYAADKFLGPLVNKIGGSPSGGIKSREASLITKNLEMGGLTPQDYADRLLASSVDDFAGELGGENLRSFAQTKANIQSPNMTAAREAMRERLATAPQRAQSIIESSFKPSPNIENMLGNLDEMGSQASKLYGAVGQEGATLSKDAISGIIATPDGQRALQVAAKNLANKQIAPETVGLVLQDGKYSLANDVPVETLNQVQKALGDLVQPERNPLTGVIQTETGITTEGLRKGLASKLREASPTLNQADTIYAGKEAGQNAFDLGRKYAKSATGEIADTIGSRFDDTLGAQERSYFNTGFQQGLQDSIQNTPIGTGNPIARIAQQRVIDRARNIVGPAEAEKLAQNIMAEKLRMDFANRGLNNSVTGEVVSNMTEAAKDVPVIANTERWIIKKALEKGSNLINSASEKRLTDALFSTTPEQKAQLAAALLRGGAPAPSNLPFIRGISNMTPMLPISTYNAFIGGGYR